MNNRNGYLDFLRSTSAFFVVVGHFRYLIFIKSSSLGASVVLLMTGFAHQSVIVFFVISGYLIGGKLLANNCNLITFNEFKSSYLTNRIARIVPAYVAALFLTVLIDSFVKIISFDINLHGEIERVRQSFTVLPSFFQITTHAFLIQSIFNTSFGSNQPLWSISYEWIIYFLFPLILYNRYAGIFVAVLLFCHNYNFLFYFLMWLVGAFASYFYQKSIEVKYEFYNVFFITLILLLLVLSKYIENQNMGLTQLVLDFLLAVAIAYSINTTGSKFPIALNNFFRFFASFSFSLYLIHFPLMILFFVCCTKCYVHKVC